MLIVFINGNFILDAREAANNKNDNKSINSEKLNKKFALSEQKFWFGEVIYTKYTRNFLCD